MVRELSAEKRRAGSTKQVTRRAFELRWTGTGREELFFSTARKQKGFHKQAGYMGAGLLNGSDFVGWRRIRTIAKPYGSRMIRTQPPPRGFGR